MCLSQLSAFLFISKVLLSHPLQFCLVVPHDRIWYLSRSRIANSAHWYWLSINRHRIPLGPIAMLDLIIKLTTSTFCVVGSCCMSCAMSILAVFCPWYMSPWTMEYIPWLLLPDMKKSTRCLTGLSLLHRQTGLKLDLDTMPPSSKLKSNPGTNTYF